MKGCGRFVWKQCRYSRATSSSPFFALTLHAGAPRKGLPLYSSLIKVIGRDSLSFPLSPGSPSFAFYCSSGASDECRGLTARGSFHCSRETRAADSLWLF